MDRRERGKRSWSGYLRLVGLLLLVFILSRLDLHRLLEIISRTNVTFLLAAVLLNVPHFFIKACRWRYLLGIQGIDYSLKDAVLAYMGSVYFGFLTPGRLGELVKVFHLKEDKSVSASRGMPSVIIDRLFDVYLVILVGTVGLWKFGLLGKVSNLAFLGLAVLAGAPFLLLSKKVMDRVAWILYRLVPGERARGKLGAYYEEFYESVRELMSWRLSIGGLLTAAAYFFFFLQCFCLARSLELGPLDYANVTFLMAITSCVTMIPISIAGLGTRDAILIFLFSSLGLGKEAAVSFSLLVLVAFYVAGGLMGLSCWLLKGSRKNKFPI
jgi:uncharacterized protein (TIRG00374 family)